MYENYTKLMEKPMDITPELLLAGIGLLILSISSIQPAQEVNIDSIQTSDIGDKVTVKGNISNIYSSGEASFINIRDETGEIEGVVFSEFPAVEGVSTVTGRIDLYQGQLQLIVNDASPGIERPVRD